MSFYEELLEHDLNPFILFDSNGKLKNFNKEAEFLFNFVTPKELFELTISYASATFGFNKKFINIKYEKQSFYAILVGYLTEDEITLRLYKEVSISEPIHIENNLQKTNIFTLIELSKNTTLLNSKLKIKEIYDISIPEIKLNINYFLITLNSIFEQFLNTKDITLKVYIKTGEYEIINNKKYNIVAIDFSSDNTINFTHIKKEKRNFNIFTSNNNIKLEIPLIY